MMTAAKIEGLKRALRDFDIRALWTPELGRYGLAPWQMEDLSPSEWQKYQARQAADRAVDDGLKAVDDALRLFE